MATNNAVNTSLSGQTGTVNFVGSTSPTLITPVLGAASATSVTFTSTTELVGTTTNNNAAAGSVGEFISSNVPVGSPVSISNNTATNITSISLTAGDWDLFGMVQTLPAATTTTSQLIAWISTTSAALPAAPNNGAYSQITGVAVPGNSPIGTPTGTMRLSLSGTTTVFLGTFITFAVSTMGAYGFIGARRRR